MPGPVAGDVEQVVVEGGGGAPVPGDGALAGGGGRAAVEPGAGRGALVPPGVVQVGDLVAEPGADGAGVAADDLADGHLADAEGAGDAGRAVAHHVQGPQPQPAAAGVDAAARDSSGWSRRAPRWWCRGRAGGGRGPGQRRWLGPGPRRRRWRGRCRRPGAGGGRGHGPGPGRWPGTAGQVGSGRDRPGG